MCAACLDETRPYELAEMIGGWREISFVSVVETRDRETEGEGRRRISVHGVQSVAKVFDSRIFEHEWIASLKRILSF